MPAEGSEALLSRFAFERLLNQDSQGQRIILVGSIDSQPALLLIERAAFSTSSEHLRSLLASLTRVKTLGDNDVYRWYLANTRSSSSSSPPSSTLSIINPSSGQDNNQLELQAPHDLKLNLIYPCTPKHISKYTPQKVHHVIETPEIYNQHVKPFIASQLSAGRLTWVHNILEGKTEVEDVIYRSWEQQHPQRPQPQPPREGEEVESEPEPESERFLLLPDLNWDRKTVPSLHLLALPLRRDKHSVRDLVPDDATWLRKMQAGVRAAVSSLYADKKDDDGGPDGIARKGEEEEEEEDEEGGVVVDDHDGPAIKMYLHYQPTYYHLHVHVVSASLEAGQTQAVGKALDLTLVISLLERGLAMDKLDLGYNIGEGGELWEKVWGPLQQQQQRDSKGLKNV